MTAGLSSLAIELLQKICDELGNEKKDLSNLRSVCKQLTSAVNPKYFSNLVLNIHKHRLHEGRSQLEDLAGGRTQACGLTRTLQIRRLAPSYDMHSPGRRWIVGSGWEAEPEDGPEVELAIQHMQEYLAPALVSLSNLRRIIWTMGEKDPHWTGPCVVGCLASLSSLEDLELHGYSSKTTISLPLTQLAGLRRIVLTGHGEFFQEGIIEKFGQIIANSPQLSYLDVKCGYSQSEDMVPALHDLLRKVPLASPLRLKHLGITGCRTRLDAITLPHLRSLTSLKLNGNVLPCSDLPSHDSQDKTSPYQPSSKTHEIWAAFSKTMIQLTDLSTDSINNALLTYLASYSGLTTLTFSYATASSGIESDVLADRFFATVLPKHASSLESLSVHAGYEGNWCFGEHNSSALLQCQKLTHLLMGVNSGTGRAQSPSDDPDNSAVPMIDKFDFILDSAAHFSQLRSLTLTPADAECNRDARCGNPSMSHASDVEEALGNSITAFRPGDSPTYPPEIRVGGQLYKLLQSEEAGGAFRYLPIVKSPTQMILW